MTNGKGQRRSILLLDADESFCQLVGERLREEGLDVVRASSRDEAMRLLETLAPKAIVTAHDVRTDARCAFPLPVYGRKFISDARALRPELAAPTADSRVVYTVPIVVVMGPTSTPDDFVDAIKRGADECVVRSRIEDLVEKLGRALGRAAHTPSPCGEGGGRVRLVLDGTEVGRGQVALSVNGSACAMRAEAYEPLVRLTRARLVGDGWLDRKALGGGDVPRRISRMRTELHRCGVPRGVVIARVDRGRYQLGAELEVA